MDRKVDLKSKDPWFNSHNGLVTMDFYQQESSPVPYLVVLSGGGGSPFRSGSPPGVG